LETYPSCPDRLKRRIAKNLARIERRELAPGESTPGSAQAALSRGPRSWVIGSLTVVLGGAISVVALLAIGIVAISHGRDELGFILALTGAIVACGLVLVVRLYGLISGFTVSGARFGNPRGLGILLLWFAVVAAKSQPLGAGLLAVLSASCFGYYFARRRRM